jgi:hypothetical protein
MNSWTWGLGFLIYTVAIKMMPSSQGDV